MRSITERLERIQNWIAHLKYNGFGVTAAGFERPPRLRFTLAALTTESEKTAMSQSDVAMDRLEDQITWYDKKSSHNERMFKRLRIATIAISVSIPLSAAFVKYAVITGSLGALIALFEGLQQLNQYHQNWITYRSTAEALKHEKYLFLSTAGSYASANDPRALLAERVESLVSQEHSKWASAQEQTSKAKDTSVGH